MARTSFFLTLHGTFGEDGEVQHILEKRGVPYTGADEATSRIAFDKEKTKEKFRAHGIPTPDGRLVHSLGEVDVPLPVFVKPNAQGSSVGTHPATTPEELAAGLADCAQVRFRSPRGAILFAARN